MRKRSEAGTVKGHDAGGRHDDGRDDDGGNAVAPVVAGERSVAGAAEEGSSARADEARDEAPSRRVVAASGEAPSRRVVAASGEASSRRVVAASEEASSRRVVAAADVERWVIEREMSGERYAVARSRAELHDFVRLMRSAGVVIRVHDVH